MILQNLTLVSSDDTFSSTDVLLQAFVYIAEWNNSLMIVD